MPKVLSPPRKGLVCTRSFLPVRRSREVLAEAYERVVPVVRRVVAEGGGNLPSRVIPTYQRSKGVCA